MKRKVFIAITCVAAIALIVWWCIPKKGLCDWIPAKSKAVVRIDAKDGFKDLQQACIRQAVGFDIPSDNLAEAAYFFVTPNDYYALALSLKDAAAFRASLSGQEVVSDDEGTWIWTQTGHLLLLTGNTLVAIGPGSRGERDRMRHTLLVMRDAPAEESFSQSPYYENLTADGEISFVARSRVLPLPYSTILRLSLPDTDSPIYGTVALEGDTVAIRGAICGKPSTTLSAPTTPSDGFLQATISVDGKTVLQRLKTDALGRYLFASLNDSVDAKTTIARMQVPIGISISTIKDDGTPIFSIQGKDAESQTLVVGSLHTDTPPQQPTSPQGLTAQVALNRRQLREAPLPDIFSSFLHTLYINKEHSHFACNGQGGFVYLLYP